MSARPMTEEPCPRCLALVDAGRLYPEALMPLPVGAFAPMARDGSGKCCLDCAAADGLMADVTLSFLMARIAVGNDRRDSYRWPPGVRMGFVLTGRMGMPHDSLEEHLSWLERTLPDLEPNL